MLERVISRDPRLVISYVILAALHAEAGRKAEAAEAVAKVRELNPLFDAAIFASQFEDNAIRERLATALKVAGF
jgi:hypothetical protein